MSIFMPGRTGGFHVLFACVTFYYLHTNGCSIPSNPLFAPFWTQQTDRVSKLSKMHRGILATVDLRAHILAPEHVQSRVLVAHEILEWVSTSTSPS
jgi:hypothetical protein